MNEVRKNGVRVVRANSKELDRIFALFAAAQEVLRRGMNVRDLEAQLKRERDAARRAAGRKADRQEDPWGDKQLREMQLALQEELGRRVTINRRGVGGILTVEYNSMDDLSDLVDRLTGGN